MAFRSIVARLQARPWLIAAGAAVTVAEGAAAFAGLAAAGLLFGTPMETPPGLVALGLFTVVPPLVVRPAPLAVLYAAARTEGYGRGDVLATVRSDYLRLLAGSAAGHAVSLALLPAALIVAAPFVVLGVFVVSVAVGQPALLSARPLESSVVKILGGGTLAVGFVLAYLPVAFADLRVQALDAGPSAWDVARAPLSSLGAIVSAPRAGGRYLAVRGAATLGSAATCFVAFAVVSVETGGLPTVIPVGVALLLAWVVATLRTFVGVLHVDAYGTWVGPALAGGGATARPGRWLAGVAVAGLLVTAPVVAVGVTTYDSPVESAYAPEGELAPSATAYAYGGRVARIYPNGSERDVFTTRRATAGDRILVRSTSRIGGDEFRRVATADGPLVYRILRPSSAEAYRNLRRGSDRESWRRGMNDTRTVYVQEWGDADVTLFDPLRVARSFAYWRVDTTTYRGIPAVAYEAKSWLLPRDTVYTPARGRLVVDRETGAMLRLNVTVTDDDSTVRFDYAFRHLDDPNSTVREAHRIVDAVRRNVTVTPALYPDRYRATPGVAAYRSGRVVGASFYLDGEGATIPAGARVTAVGANGTNYTTTLSEPETPDPAGVPIVFDLVFETTADGGLVRREPEGLTPVPGAAGPNLTRLVVRDPATGLTYVDANVTVAPIEDVRTDRRTVEGERYVSLLARPDPGPVQLQVESVATGETVYDHTLQLDAGYLVWIGPDWLILGLEQPSGRLITDGRSSEKRQYVVRVYGPRGLLVERTVTLSRPRPATPTPTAG